MSAIQQVLLAYVGAGGGGGGDPYFASVVFLAHFDGANGATVFTEVKGKTLAASGDAQLSTSSPKFGTASLLLDGNGDYANVTSSVTDFLLGTNDFTVEAYFKTSTLREQVILDFYMTGQPTWQIELNSSGRPLWYAGAPSGAVVTGTSVLTDDAWHHVEVDRASGTMYLFIDGNLEASAADTHDYNFESTTFAIGAQVSTRNPAYDFPGNIDEVRVTNGVARHTANFTPTGPFPNS